MRENKLVILGAGGVGKTSLVMQLLEGFFSYAYKPTVEDYYRHTLQLPNGMFHTVEILDTAGSHHFPAMRELSIRSSRAFVLVFSVDNEQSFYEVVSIWQLITQIKGEKSDVPVILVGNKVDLEDERKVSREVAQTLSDSSMSNCKYIETSAKYNVNVNQLFAELVMKAFYDTQPQAAASSHSSERSAARRLSRKLSALSFRSKSAGSGKLKVEETDHRRCSIL